jgi:hypothetical protein
MHHDAAPLDGGRLGDLHDGRQPRQMAHVACRKSPVKSRTTAPLLRGACIGCRHKKGESESFAI